MSVLLFRTEAPTSSSDIFKFLNYYLKLSKNITLLDSIFLKASRKDKNLLPCLIGKEMNRFLIAKNYLSALICTSLVVLIT